MNTLVFRELTREDESFLWEMLYQALYVPVGSAPYPRSVVDSVELRRYVEGWGEEPDDAGVLAVDQGVPVGAVWIRRLRGDKAGYGFVDEATPELSIAVLPEYRGRGVGSQLLQRLFDNAADRHRSLSLSVSADNPAVKLYRRHGFEIVSAIDDSLIMRRAL